MPWVSPPIRVRRWPRRTTSWKVVAESEHAVVEQYHWPKNSSRNNASSNDAAPCYRIITKCTPHLKVFQSRDQAETYEGLYFLRDEILPCLEGRVTSAKIANLLKNVATLTNSGSSIPDPYASNQNSHSHIPPSSQPPSARGSPTREIFAEANGTGNPHANGHANGNPTGNGHANGSVAGIFDYSGSDSPDADEFADPEPSRRWALENDPPSSGRMRLAEDADSTPYERKPNGFTKRPILRWRLNRSSGTGTSSTMPTPMNHDYDSDDEADESSGSWEDVPGASQSYANTPAAPPTTYRYPAWLAWLETIQHNSDAARRVVQLPYLLVNLLIYPDSQLPGSNRVRIQDLRERHLVRQRRRVLAAFSLFCVLVRWCSWDAFLLIMVVANAALLYLMKNSRKINVTLAKRKVRRQVGWAKTWAGGIFTRRGGKASPTAGGDDAADGLDSTEAKLTGSAPSGSAAGSVDPGPTSVGSAGLSDKSLTPIPGDTSGKEPHPPTATTSTTSASTQRRRKLLGLSRRSQSASSGAQLIPAPPSEPASAPPGRVRGTGASPPALTHASTMPNAGWASSSGPPPPPAPAAATEERSLFHRRKKSVETALTANAAKRISAPMPLTMEVAHDNRRGSGGPADAANWSRPPSYREAEET